MNSSHESVIIFRLGVEWFALPTDIFEEIASPHPVHQIPHLSGQVILGFVNWDGQLQLTINLHAFLHIERTNEPHYMAAIKDKEALWIFAVDEIEGICLFDALEVQAIALPFLVAENYSKGIIKKEKKSITVLDPSLIFSSLQRLLQHENGERRV